MTTKDSLTIDHARENNLKDLTLEIPHDQLVGITGLSGSGKSSLAFDTIYAEGQRRYIETFSPYTRQFFDKVKRPKVDLIENVRPALAIQQRTRILNSRSTVGSMTDINDYLKILWSNLATPVCPACRSPLDFWDPKAVTIRISRWVTLKPHVVFLIGATIPNTKEAIERLTTLGYIRYYDPKSGELKLFEDHPPARKIKDLLVVIDRVRGDTFESKRVRESLEQAFSLGNRSATVVEQRAKSTRPLLRVTRSGTQKIPSKTEEIHRFWNGYQCGDGEVKVDPPRPSLFSFNHPIGACTECTGFGKILVVDPNKCVPDHSKSISKGAIECWRGESSAWEQKQLIAFCKENEISISSPWSELKPTQKDLIFNHKSRKFVGIFPWFKYLEQKKYKMHVRVFLARYRGQIDCPRCNGTRLKPDALAYLLDGHSITDAWKLSLATLLPWLHSIRTSCGRKGKLPRQIKDIFENVLTRVQYLVDLGLPYLTLDRQSRTLSGGETQRVNLVSAIGSGLVSSQFVLDEPSVGLHARDSEQLIKALRDLTDRGNSVTMVEHDPDCLNAADSIIELGPHAGAHGGEVVYNGPRSEWGGLKMGAFEPANFLAQKEKFLTIGNARNRNLKNLSVKIPLESFVCLTGVSGSGKSSLLTEVIEAAFQLYKGLVPPETTVLADISGFEQVSDVLLIDQSPLAKSPRANIATYTKVWDKIRECLATTDEAIARKLTKSSFSFNVNAGRCPVCEGAGFIREDMQFLSDVYVECEACLGRRFQATVLEVTYKGKNVHDFLQMTVDECNTFFASDTHISSATQLLSQLGLGHTTLGHPLSELSGGEAQRLKLVPHIVEGQKRQSLFLFDEPTTGLHIRDVERLLELFHFLKDKGHSIVCVEHNLRLIAEADWIIDLGPEGGDQGGYVVKEGTPHDFTLSTKGANGTVSLTAQYLAQFCKEYALRHLNAVKVPTVPKKRLKGRAIEIRGAREHNLKDISLSIPLHSFVTLTGVSGSGKSTIAKDILYAEGQRRYLDCLSPYARQFIKELKKPDIDDIANVQPTICVYQHTFQPSALSTVGTMSEVYNFLRLLFAKIGVQYCPDHPEESISPLSAEQIASSIAQSGNKIVRLLAPVIKQKKGNHRAVLQRAIDTEVTEVRVDGRINSPSSFLEEGLAKTKPHSIEYAVAKFNPKNLPLALILESVQHALALGGGDVIVLGDKEERLFSSQRTCPKCQRGFFKPDPEDLSFHSRRGRCTECDGVGTIKSSPCTECHGTRLNSIGRHIKILDKNISQLCQRNAAQVLRDLEAIAETPATKEIAEPIIKELRGKLSTLIHLGLDYIALGRDCITLSSGELQRLRLATAIGSPLSGVTYIFDEPSAGLHPADNKRLISKLLDLKERGNTVLQIEHELDSILRSEMIIDVGPGAGKHGGEIVFQGSVAEAIASAQSQTGIALRTPLELSNRENVHDPTTRPMLEIQGATKNNLRNLSVSIPLQSLVTVAGVSGAGKTSLVHGVLVEALSSGKGSKESWKCKYGGITSSLSVERLLLIDQKPIGKTSRSTPASYLGMWDEIRKIYATTLEAKSRGWTASYFSHNTGKGRCQMCKGQGELTLEMSFLAEAKVACEECNGSRFTLEADSVKYKELAISEVLKLTFEDAKSFFVHHKKIHQICRLACDLGLGYIALGQPSSTLSGGEAQRLKLVAELHVERRGHSLYILDEPTTGLHRSDVHLLLKGLRALVNQGHTVLLIEHDSDAIAHSDWIVELGPGPGEKGGSIIFEGTPAELLRENTPWGEAIRERISLHQSLRDRACSDMPLSRSAPGIH